MGSTEVVFVGDSFRWIICASLTLIIILLGAIIGRKSILIGLGGTMMFVVFIGIGYLIYMLVKKTRPQVGDWIAGKNFIWIVIAIYAGLFIIGTILQVANHFVEKADIAKKHHTSLSYELGRGVNPNAKSNALRSEEHNQRLREEMRRSNEQFQRDTDLANQQFQRDMEQAQRDFDNFNNNNFNNNNGFPPF